MGVFIGMFLRKYKFERIFKKMNKYEESKCKK